MSAPPIEGAPLLAYLSKVTGFQVPDDRWRAIAPGLLARASLRGFRSGEDYVRHLAEDRYGRQELEEVLAVLTVRKTSFFRNPAAFDALARDVLPPLVDALARGGPPPSIWSAGCATGEEPYSIAMVARSLAQFASRPCYILATDIVTSALLRGRRGVYGRESLVDIPERYRHLVSLDEGRLEVAEATRSSVEFHAHNLVRDPLPRPASGLWDVIFCRNVLIYFGADVARRLLESFHDCLSPRGVLFLGHAEVLWGLDDRFDVVFSGDTFFYRKRDRRLGDTRVVPRIAQSVQARLARVAKLEEPRPTPGTEEETRDLRSAGRPHAPPSGAPGSGVRPRLPLPLPAFVKEPARGVSDSTPTRPLPVLPFDQLARAEALLTQGDADGAARALRAAVARAPSWSPPRVLLGKIYADRGETDMALAELEVAIRVEPLEARAHLLVGTVRERRNEREAAEDAYRRAIYLEPDLAAARYALAQIYKATGRTDRARRELRNVVRTLTSKPPDIAARYTDGVSPAALAGMCERELKEMEGR